MNLLGWITVAVLVAGAGLCAVALWMRTVTDEPGDWHVDLRIAERASYPHDYLISTTGYTVAEQEDTGDPVDDAQAWLAQLDAVATAERRTVRLAGSPQEGRITWVQRSMLFGFPDYITAQADADGWAIWSRSRFGRSDLGVNEQRIDHWREAATR